MWHTKTREGLSAALKIKGDQRFCEVNSNLLHEGGMSTLVELVWVTASHLWCLGGDLSREDEEEGTWAGAERSWAVAGAGLMCLGDVLSREDEEGGTWTGVERSWAVAIRGLMCLGGDLSREESLFKGGFWWPVAGVEDLKVRCLDDRCLGGGGGSS